MPEDVVIAEASVAPQPEPVVVPEPKPVGIEEFVHKQYEQHEATLAAAESKPEEAAVASEAKAADKPEAIAEAKPQPAAEEVPFTPEQLADPKHWDRLDKAGWERAAKLHPVETARVKAGYAAASRITEDARRVAATSRPEPEKKEEPKADPYAEALEKTDSLDPSERAEGFRTLARLEAEKLLRERDQATGFDPVEAQAHASERAAYRAAVDQMPELAELPSAELDAAVEADPELTDDVKFAVSLEPEARTVLLAKVMRRAGRIVLSNRAAAKAAADADATKKAKEAKDAEVQRRLRSNEDNPSKVVAETPGGKTPKGERTIEETIHEKVAALKSA